MSPRGLVVFKHSSHLGNARSGELFQRVVVHHAPDAAEPPRSFAYYQIEVIETNLPSGITVEKKI